MSRTLSLTVDVETDWGGRMPPSQPNSVRGIRAAVPRLLELFDRFQAHATFFVSGEVAGLIREELAAIQNAGHEIGAHAFSHRMATTLSEGHVREEYGKAKDVLESMTGTRVSGYRAPQFRYGPHHFAALEATGYRYDSSVLMPAHKAAIPYKEGGVWEVPLQRQAPFGFSPGLLWLQILGLRGLGRPQETNEESSRVIYMHPFDFLHSMPRPAYGLLPNLWYCRPRANLYSFLEKQLALHGRKRYRFVSIGETLAGTEQACPIEKDS